MFQIEDDLFHHQSTFENDPRSVEQHQAPHQAYDQMAVVRRLALHLTGPRRQQVLQGSKTVLNPVAPLPCLDEPRAADGCFETHHVKLIYTALSDYDDGHRAIGWTGGSQPRIAYPRDLHAVAPGPIAWLVQVVPLDLASVWEREDIRRFPFHKQGALVCRSPMLHQL